MPDVGVLNLQIHDNSSTAAEGLGRLAAKLEAVKAAVSGVRLTPVVNGINKINEALKKIDESAITKLNKITDALERLGKVTGDVGGIRISFGGRGQSAEEIATSMQAARAAISDANSDFEDFKATVQEVSTQDEELARSVNGVKQSVNQLDFSVFDPAKLPLDALGMKLDDNAKELYQWKSAIKESFESVQQLKSKDLIKSFEEAEAAMKATKDAGEFGKDIVTSISEATDALKELKEIAAQKWDTNFQQWFDSLEQTIQKLNEKLNAEQSKKRPSERAIAELSATIDAYKKKLADLQDQQTRFTNGTYFAGEAIKKEFADVPTEELGGKIEEVKNRIETMREALGKSDGSDAESIEKYNAMLDAMSAELEKAQAKWKAFTDQDNGNENKQAVFKSIKDAANAMGISVDEAKRRLQQTYETVYANQSGTTSFSSAEEAAGSLGISLEEVKRKCQETYDLVYGTGSTGSGSGDIFSHVEEGAETARTLLDMLLDKVQILQDEIDTGKTANGTLLSDKAIVNNEIQVEKLKQQIEQLQERIRAGQSLNGADFVANLGDYSKIDLYKMKLDAMQQSLINDINANKLDAQAIIERSMRIMDLTDKIRDMEAGQEEASEGAETLGEKLKNMFPKLDALKERFKNLLKYRILRSVIKQISDGLQEGIENYYYYSQAIGGNFATSMDNAASSLLTMKNSIGAAVAPLISSLIPYLQTVVNLFVEAVNYVNQFFALLNGQSTWSRATAATATAFDDIADSASGASDSVSDLLADWDELNIIQNESSGGGSGTGVNNTQDYLDMFEEVSSYDETIKDIVNFIKDNFDTILSIVEGIGVAILAWKISKAFGNDLSTLQKIELMAGFTLLINGIKVSTAAGYDIGKNGINGDNILSAVAGILETSIGGGLVGLAFGGVTGGVIGLTVGALVSLAILGFNISQGQKDALYGDLELTADEIQTEVDRLFSIDVNAELRNAQLDHDNIVNARQAVIDSLHNMEADFATFEIRATPENAASLLASVNETVEATNTLLTYFGKKISIGFGLDDVTKTFTVDKLGDAKQYITDLGTEIGKILEDGTVSEFEKTLYEELKQKLSNVTRALALGETSTKFVSELEKGNYGTDWTQANRQTLIEYAQKYEAQVADAEEAGYLQAVDTRTGLRSTYDYMVQRNKDEPGVYSEKEIQDAWDNYKAYDENKMQEEIADYVNQATAEGRDIFIKNMSTALDSAIDKANLNTGTMARSILTGSDLNDYINDNLALNIGWNTEQFGSVLNTMDINGWDLLDQSQKDAYIDKIIATLKPSEETYQRLKDELGVSVEEAVSSANWDKYSDEAREKLIGYLSSIYGDNEVIEAIKNTNAISFTELMHISDELDDDEVRKSFISLVESAWGVAQETADAEEPIELPVSLTTGLLEGISETDFDIAFDVPEEEGEVDIWEIMGIPEEGIEVPVIPDKEQFRTELMAIDPVEVQVTPHFSTEDVDPNALNWGGSSQSGASYWEGVNSALASVYEALNTNMSTMFGTITINTERNDEQDTNNIAEGTKRGNVGLEAKLGQLNSTMSQLNGNVVNIATKIGGGLTNIGASATGSLISNALNAFNMVKG